ncbi:MAG: permease [Candidatus Marinimicrobia bacterium]|nr:permease [Candidatus Neomarinimicrobiota bacterium]OUW71424.1 MAG: permease [Rickettsiales bacterium TMED211]|tara:strand:- start:614 stop:1645 length:1032 start_codon:yes stop_codon:yes gene_type:complete
MTKLVLKSYQNIRRNLEWFRSVWFLAALIPLAVLVLDPENTTNILQIAVTALGGTLPYIAFAVLTIGYLKATGAEAVVAKAFEGNEYRMILFAAFLGGWAPFCSCEVIPFIAGLLAVGAPLSAVMAFWLSSPLIDPPQLLITAGALGWDFAIGKALSAVGLGLLGGFAVSFFVKRGAFAEPLRPGTAMSCCGANPFSGKPVWQFWQEDERRRTFFNSSSENAIFLLKWLTFAYLIEALLIDYVPAKLIAGVVGGEGILPIVTGALVGAPAYLNGFAAAPLVAGLMEQGMTAGAAMAFMTAGSVSSIPAMAAVWSLVKRQVFVAYLSLGIIGAIIAGILYQAVV